MVRWIPAQTNAAMLRPDDAVALLTSGPHLMHLGVITPDGRPLVHPVWFLFHEELFYVHLGRLSPKLAGIGVHPHVYFTIDQAPPQVPAPRGIRGPGVARRVDAPSRARWAVEQHCIKYVGSLEKDIAQWLLAGVDRGKLVVIAIQPEYLATWDFARQAPAAHG